MASKHGSAAAAWKQHGQHVQDPEQGGAARSGSGVGGSPGDHRAQVTCDR